MNHFNLVSILLGMYLVHPSDHTDTQLSGLLRYMKCFFLFESDSLCKKWRSGQQRERLTVSGHCWTRLPLMYETVCESICTWHLLSLVTEGVCWHLIPALTFWPQRGLSVWLRQQNRGSRWLELWTDGFTVFCWRNASTCVCLFTTGLNRLRGQGQLNMAQHAAIRWTWNMRSSYFNTKTSETKTFSSCSFNVISQHSIGYHSKLLCSKLFFTPSSTLTSGSNWLRIWTQALTGCWPCLYEQKGLLAVSRPACSAAH